MRKVIVMHRQEVRRAATAPIGFGRGSDGLRVTLLGLLLAVSSCGYSGDGDKSHKVNGAVHVDAGTAAGSAETVNGSIDVDPKATVTKAATVNGSIQFGAHANADSVETVNGAGYVLTTDLQHVLQPAFEG